MPCYGYGKIAVLMARLAGSREKKIDGYAFSNGTKRANVPDSRQGLDAGNETSSADSWNGFSLSPTCQGVTGQARFGFSIPAICHLHAWMFLASPRGMQTCKASKIQIGFLEAKADVLVKSTKTVIPAKAGIQKHLNSLYYEH